VYRCCTSISLCHGHRYDRWVYEVREVNRTRVLEYYCPGIIECFGVEFLRRSTVADTQCLLAKTDEHEFPGMLESIDYMHWQWHNCPVG
jgi:hypothetical protein